MTIEDFVESKMGEANSFDISEAQYWLRAFVKVVRKRALQLDEPGGPPTSALISIAFNVIADELDLNKC